MSLQLSKDWAKQNLPIFKVFADQGKHPAVAMDRPVCVIGRQYGVNLPLNAPQVSRYHALIVRDGGHIYLRDLASTNGVERNGQPVGEASLHDAYSLRIGAFTLRCDSGFDRNGQLDGEKPDPAVNDELRVANDAMPFPPDRRTLLIGRRAQCELQPDGDDVAPAHAVIFVMDGKRFVRDLNTPGGTFVNGEPVHQTELRPGDVLRVGSMTMEYVKSAAPHDESRADAPAELDESRIPLVEEPLVDEPIDEADRSDAPLIAVADEPEPPPLDRPEDEVSSVESRAEALLGGSSIVGEIFESHYDLPAPAPEQVEPKARPEAEPALASAAEASAVDAELGSTGTTPSAPIRAPVPAPAPEIEPEPDHGLTSEPGQMEIVELPGAQAAARGTTSGDAPSHGAPGISQNGDGPTIELVPAAGVAVPKDLSAAPSDADEKYVVPVSELTLTSLPSAATAGEPLDDPFGARDARDPRPHRDPRADAAGDTIAGEEVITTLVDELANRATTLKSAWEEHRASQEQRDGAAASPVPSPGTQGEG